MLKACRALKHLQCTQCGCGIYRTKLVPNTRFGHQKNLVSVITTPPTRQLSSLDKLYPAHHVFAERHIGPNKDEAQAMLEFIGLEVYTV